MKRFFSKLKDSSGSFAKNRLKTVINGDRINTSGNLFLDKVRKDFSELMMKYTEEKNNFVKVQIKGSSPSHISVSVSVTFDIQKEKINEYSVNCT